MPPSYRFRPGVECLEELHLPSAALLVANPVVHHNHEVNYAALDRLIDSHLRGKWREIANIPSAYGGTVPAVTEVVFTGSHHFTSVSRSGPYFFYSAGNWRVHNTGILTL